ncbi:hypothetical protein CEUSTIGMA_g5455.t1 [Chlamydomonas eustigma]|uniref:Copper transporter n=1 Tax=Chlamydomonas eustigma TaxID=1157962 RepID=A0A250X4K9_9CHLO|nr:hypothetical protein CEUSTIGMA_g5455.t1 [Chlamydomonas eustigma]|eukprot:GAX78013.1 hypothetical protein CEUSTIGMA_g5455.t1 [Chlamydomonas eustigma]
MTLDLFCKLHCQVFSATLLLFLLSAAWASDVVHPVLELEHFTLSQLKNPEAKDIDRLKYAVFEVGLFAVTDFSQAASPSHHTSEPHVLESPVMSDEEPFHGTLHAYALCAQSGLVPNEIHTTELADSTLRNTVALSTNRSIAQPMPTSIMESCPVFTESARKLREEVDLTGRAYARVLDRLVHGLEASEPATPRSGVMGDSFVSAVLRAESLEHFHLFQRRAPPSDQPSLDMHSDMGLFLIMTAAEYFSALDADQGDGSRLAPDQGCCQSLVWSHTYQAFKEGKPCEASTAGCPSARRALSDDGACGAGQVYCWMQCMSISGLGCSQNDTICVDPSGDLWPQDFPQGTSTHCPTCSLQCAGAPPLPPATGFCDTRLTPVTMWMTGFQFSGKSSDACVVYLFSKWTLDTSVKFAFACIGTFFLGVVVIALGVVRQFFWKRHDGLVYGSQLQNWGMIVGVTFTYMVQLTLSYCVMLFVMTYQAELFIMSVLGLATGHFYFDIYRRWAVHRRSDLRDVTVVEKSILISLNSEMSSPLSISPQRSCCGCTKPELSSKSDRSSGSGAAYAAPEVHLEEHGEMGTGKQEVRVMGT